MDGLCFTNLATPVQFWLGAGFYRGMWASLKMATFNMDSLIAIGTSTTYFYSLYNFVIYSIQNRSVRGEIGDSILKLLLFLITFVLLGKWLETQAKGKTGEAIQKLMGLQAKLPAFLEMVKRLTYSLKR